VRTIIIGAPKTGKTTLATHAAKVGLLVPVYHTDSLIPGRSWAAQGDAAFDLLVRANHDEPDGFVYEGVLAVRALSRWLKTRKDSPCDQLLVLTTPRVAQTPEQQRLGKGMLTQFQPLIPGLRALGVEIEWVRE
jgi:adenylate kinase family enzyme